MSLPVIQVRSRKRDINQEWAEHSPPGGTCASLSGRSEGYFLLPQPQSRGNRRRRGKILREQDGYKAAELGGGDSPLLQREAVQGELNRLRVERKVWSGPTGPWRQNYEWRMSRAMEGGF